VLVGATLGSTMAGDQVGTAGTIGDQVGTAGIVGMIHGSIVDFLTSIVHHLGEITSITILL
jgi:hypothetical protein